MIKTLWPVMAILVLAASGLHATVVDSPHDLSVTGSGNGDDTEICKFCHTPHRTADGTGLFRQSAHDFDYIPYSSGSMSARPASPNGTSKLCLGCHDGTIARRDPHGIPRDVSRGGRRNGTLGTDLSDDHPVSIDYRDSYESETRRLRPPDAIAEPVALDGNGFVQCTSCHDPHDNRFHDFLVTEPRNSRLCISCHDLPGWNASAHNRSGSSSRADRNGFKGETVGETGCGNCHEVHGAATPERLLTGGGEAELCLGCHDGRLTRVDVRAAFQYFSRHPLASGFRPASGGGDGSFPGDVFCSDCHDPHAAGRAGSMRLSVETVAGVNRDGNPVPASRFQYEICYRCHGDAADSRVPDIPRQIDDGNVRREFNRDNPSFHPLESPGRNPDVPSLLDPLTPASVIACTDCHAAPDSETTGRAPHGSPFAPILIRRYVTSDGLPESPAEYALCYGCHSRDILLSAKSGFTGHYLHVVEVRTSCASCHDPHGISATRGNDRNNSHLINFKTDVVHPDGHGSLRYTDRGYRRGSCTLECHGTVHEDTGYGPGLSPAIRRF